MFGGIEGGFLRHGCYPKIIYNDSSVPLGSDPRPGFFSAPLQAADPEVAAAISKEYARQQRVVNLIASENIVSQAVLDAQGSVLTNKTVEGYPGRRYHGGAEHVDVIETLAIERACRLFGCKFANVQAHSGSQANNAVFVAMLNPGDTVLSMDLNAGGHLSHGAAVNISGKWFNIVAYGVDRENGRIDYADVERLAIAHSPKLIIAGGSAYPRAIDFAAFRAIADVVGARLLVDIAHFAGLVAGGAHPDPVPHADVVTTTSTKSLRGARGGLILVGRDAALAKRIDQAIFPGLQGSPALQIIAAKAVCLGEALRPEFRLYAQSVLDNARALAATLIERGLQLVTGGTDTPLLVVDLRGRAVTGDIATAALERAGITCNKNAVPFDPEPPMVTSGVRLGVSTGTTRGFGIAEFTEIGHWIADVLDSMAETPEKARAAEQQIYTKVCAMTARYPIYEPVHITQKRRRRRAG